MTLLSNTFCDLNSILTEVSPPLSMLKTNSMETYWYTCRLIALHQVALINQVWISLHFRTQLLFSFAVLVLFFTSVAESSSIGAIRRAGIILLALFLHRASNIFKVRRIPGLYDVIGCQNGPWRNEAKMLTKFEIRGVRWLVMIEKHQVDMVEGATAVQSLDGVGTRTNDDFDDVAKTCKVHQRHDDSCELGISFQTEVPLSAGLTNSITKQYA